MENSPSEEKIRECLQLQLSEVEMLECMFANPGEFTYDDPSTVVEMREFLENEVPLKNLLSRIGFTVKVDIPDEGDEKVIMEVVCHLPMDYPAVPPEVFLRMTCLSKTMHRQFMEDWHTYIIEDLERDEICIGPIIEWVKEKAPTYLELSKSQLSVTTQVKTMVDDKFTRMWIYSHHIYSKIKRKDILDFSSELNLTGFSMPGKPGIIVIEGFLCDVEEFWQRIRQMQWKKISMKDREVIKIEDSKDISQLRKFSNFEEKHFDTRQGKGRGAHMDRGQLYQYLISVGCGHIFNVYFGVDGHLAGEDD